MVPEGVTVVAALHTVGAPTLADADAELGEDVLVCGDRKADKARVARLIELIPGLRAVNAGPLEMARIVEQLTPMLISVNTRYKAHAGHPAHRPARRRPLGVSAVRVACSPAAPAAPSSAPGCRRRSAPTSTVIANTGDDIETLGVHVSPDPDLVTYWLSGEIDEERGWGLRDDTFTVFERMAELGAPDWFSLSDRDLAACLYRRQFLDEGGRLTDAQAQIARGARGRGAGAADVRRRRCGPRS